MTAHSFLEAVLSYPHTRLHCERQTPVTMVNPLIRLASLSSAPSESVRNLNQRFNFSTEGFKLIRGSHANKELDTSINQSGVGGLLREDVYSWRPHI